MKPPIDELGILRDIRMRSYLEFEAFLETKYVHPGGLATTRRMLSAMELTGSHRALDLGCGTGATAGMAAATGAEVIAFERMPAMLASTRRHCPSVSLVQGDARHRLPFTDDSFDAVWAESVVALLDPSTVIPEIARVLRPGGRVALNERIWREGTTVADATAVNRLSLRCFGMTAAATDPLDRDGWAALMESTGIVLREITPVGSPAARDARLGWRDVLTRQLRYLSSPAWLAASMRWRWLIRRHRKAWSQLESWIFVGERTP